MTDHNGTTLAGATVVISGGVASDTLTINGAISGTINDGAAGTIGYSFSGTTLALTGTDTVTDYITALDEVEFSAVSQNSGIRTLTWTVNDESGGNINESLVQTTTVDVDPAAPSITTLVGQPLTGQTVELQGTGEVGDTVDLYADGNSNTIVGSGIVGAGGTFDITTTATFGTGPHTFTATEIDAAPLTSAVSTPAFQVTVVHQAPAMTAGGTATFSGAGPVVLDAGVTVSDVDSGGTLAGATVTISSGFIAGDTLEIGGQTSGTITDSGGTINYAFTGSTLTLSGTDTLADYQAALDSITYSFSPSGGDATAAGADTSRTISWQVNDGAASNGVSNVDTSTLLVPTTPVVTPAAVDVNASAEREFRGRGAVLGERRRGRADSQLRGGRREHRPLARLLGAQRRGAAERPDDYADGGAAFRAEFRGRIGQHAGDRTRSKWRPRMRQASEPSPPSR